MKIKGWREVFAFTFTQQVKTKSFIIGTVVITLIVAVIAFLADFLPTVFLSDQFDKITGAVNGEDTMTVDMLYVSNETDYDLNFVPAAVSGGIKCKMITAEEADAKIAELENSTEAAMVARITVEDGGFVIDSRYTGGENSPVDKSDCEALNKFLSTELQTQFLSLQGVSGDELQLALGGVYTQLSSAGEEPTGMVQYLINTVVPMLSSIILFIFIFSYSTLVGQAVAIEKSSRIIEYLLTSIKPLAIILGKVLAMCCVSLLQFIIIGAGGAIGFIASLPFGIFTKIGEISASVGQGNGGAEMQGIIDDIGAAFSQVNPGVFVVMIVTFILGFLLFAGIAGLAGASISKMEDLSAAMQPLSLIGVLGFYLAYFPQVTGDENMMTTLVRYIPISSPFILPTDYMLGRIGLGETLICIAILVAADILVMMLVAKVYENIILHTGSRLKLGDMLKMSK